MEILVYGAGVVGSIYAARLRQAGHMVTLLARGRRAEDLRQHGIVIEAVNTGRTETVHVMVTETLEPNEAYDLVIVAMRQNQLAAALPLLAANLHTPDILFLGNNPAGPDHLTAILGCERVLLGFGVVGGIRQGGVIRTFERKGRLLGWTYLGELDGRITPRLENIIIALTEARLGPQLVADMDAWLKSHAAVVGPLALAVYAAGGDNYRLARTRDGLVLAVRAIKETLGVLEGLGIPLTPPSFRIMRRLPEPLLVAYLRSMMGTHAAQISMAGHANAARDEMGEMVGDMAALARASGRPTPAFDRLCAFLDPDQSPLPEGSAAIALDMRAVWVGLGILSGVISLALLSRPRKKG
jgi:2-dehydropantoate 2-reductase